MKKIFLVLVILSVSATLFAKPSKKEIQMKQEQLLDRMELRELVERYAAESDKGLCLKARKRHGFQWCGESAVHERQHRDDLRRRKSHRKRIS